MELGATVCRPRAPRCGECPVARRLRARLRPSRRAARPGAPRFEDTDRWARGRVVAALLAGEELPVTGERRERALAGLERDGLVVRDAGRLASLPAVTPARPYPERPWIGTESSAATSRRAAGATTRPRWTSTCAASPTSSRRSVARRRRRRSPRPPPSRSARSSRPPSAAPPSCAPRRGREAADHVARVQEAAEGMLAKLDELECELGRLLDRAARRAANGSRRPRASCRRTSARHAAARTTAGRRAERAGARHAAPADRRGRARA